MEPLSRAGGGLVFDRPMAGTGFPRGMHGDTIPQRPYYAAPIFPLSYRIGVSSLANVAAGPERTGLIPGPPPRNLTACREFHLLTPVLMFK